MSDLDVMATIDDCGEESAAEVLSMIETLKKRARNLQQRIWLLPAVLGITTIMGTSLLSTRQIITSCWMTTRTFQHVPCTISHSSTGITVLTTQGAPILGPITGSFTGRSAAIWSIGDSPWFWVIGIVASVTLSVLCQRSSGRLRTFTMTYLFAGLIGIFALLVSNKLSLPDQLSHLLAVSLIICVAGFGARSPVLAVVAALSFFVGIALSRQSAEIYARLNILIPSHSISYLASGLVLLFSSVALYWQTRPPCVSLEYQMPEEITHGISNISKLRKGG